MKSSLKFTAIALLLGGVLQVQNLNAATATIPVDMFQELGNPSGRLIAADGAKEFAKCVETLVSQKTDMKIIRAALVKAISYPVVTLEFLEGARVAASTNVKGVMCFCEGVKTGRISGDVVIAVLREEIGALQSSVNELSEGIDGLQRDVNDLSSNLGKALQRLQSADVRIYASYLS